MSAATDRPTREEMEMGNTDEAYAQAEHDDRRAMLIALRNEYQDRCTRYLDQAERFKAERDAALAAAGPLAEACRAMVASQTIEEGYGFDSRWKAECDAMEAIEAALAAFEAGGEKGGQPS